MTKKELESTCEVYNNKIEDWEYFELAYDGGMDFIEDSLRGQNARESYNNWKERIDAGINFNYCQAIVDLFNFYLTEKPAVREWKDLEKDKQWQMFLQDADLQGVNYDEWMNEAQKLSSVFGTLGILVDKPRIDMEIVADEISNGVYPYCSAYTPPNILSWEYGKNINSGRPELKFIKLRDSDGKYRLWWPTRWEMWELGKYKKPECTEEGINPLGIIPFIWLPNIKSLVKPYIGISDIKDISRIVASIIRNLSSGEEIIKFAGFPMMRKPIQKEGNETAEDEVGQQSVLEFDPDAGAEGKPDWLESVIGEPIEAILKWIDRKVDEIFRVAHLSGVHGQRKSNNEVASGLALRYEFQQLTSVLSKKSENMCEAEKNIIKFWLLWQKKSEFFDSVTIKRSKSFSVDDLSVNLKNLVEAMKSVASRTFRQKTQEQISKSALPDLNDEDRTKIKTELEEAANAGIFDVNTDEDKKWLSGQ